MAAANCHKKRLTGFLKPMATCIPEHDCVDLDMYLTSVPILWGSSDSAGGIAPLLFRVLMKSLGTAATLSIE